jgi:hypothetical protein
MSLIDVVARVVARPAGRVVEAPVRDVVDEVLREHPMASPEDLRVVSAEIGRVAAQIKSLEERLAVLVNAVNELQRPTESEDVGVQADKAAHTVLEEARSELIRAATEAARGAAREAARAAVNEAVAEAVAAAVATAGAAAPAEAAPAEAAEPEAAPAEAAPAEAPAEEAPAEEAPAEEAPAKEEAPAEAAAPEEAADVEAAEEEAAEVPAAVEEDQKVCKLPDCERAFRARGFCGKHYQAWKRGTLEGFVSPEGLLYHGRYVLQVDTKYAGSEYTITGRGKKLKVKADGEKVDYTLQEREDA